MTDENLPGGSAEIRPDLIFRDIPSDDAMKPALNTTEGVEIVVRDHLKRAVDMRGDYLAGKATNASAWTEAEAKRLTRVFFGSDDAYQAFPWNSPDQLGYAFGDRVGIEGDDANEIMETFWQRFDAQAFALMADHEGGMDDDQAKFQIDVLVEEAVYALLGLPLSAD